MRLPQLLACTSLLFLVPALVTEPRWSLFPLLNIALSVCVTLVSTRYWWRYPTARHTILHTVDRILARSAFVLNHGLLVYDRLSTGYRGSWLPSLVGSVAYICSCWCDELDGTHRFVLPHAVMHLAFVWQWCRVASRLT
jgi:hypothetical protein